MGATDERRSSGKQNEFGSQFVTELSAKSALLAEAAAKEAAGQELNTEEKSAKKEIDIEEHMLTEEQVLGKYESHKEKGLTDAQVAANLELYGKNELTPPKKTPMILIFISHLTGFFSLLLWVASILCFIAYGLKQSDVENLYLGIVLAVVVVMTGIFSFYQDFQSAAVMEGFKNFLPETSEVFRNGETLSVDSSSLVPGDIVKIKGGNKIPADIRILNASSFKVNNSSLTGESLPLKRDGDNTHESPLEATNLAFFGTLAEAGSCTAIVIRTGDKTVIGTIAKLTTQTGNQDTPIAKEIHHFITIISCVAIFLGITFLIIGFAMGLDPITNLVFAIGIIVANVPEGLLATVTVSLTLTAKRMAVKQVLVKNLEAVETLGSTTVIASDKTGTLTQNIMTVKHVFYDQEIKLAHGEGGASYEGESETFKRLRLVASLCNNAKFDNNAENMKMPIQNRVCLGDASESALLKFCETSGPNVDEVRAGNGKLAEIPFSSANKYQVSIHMMSNNPEQNRLLVMKGAPERIITRCDYMLIKGKPEPITEDMIAKYESDIRSLMEDGERVLGMAYCELDPNKYHTEFEYDTDEPNFPMNKGEGLVFTGLMALQDPPREAVPRAVLSCQKAGIKVIMVTGDHPDTAEAIAKQVNIITGKTRKVLARERGVPIEEVDPEDPSIVAVVITGAELLEMSDEVLQNRLDFTEIVFARTSPAQKLRIVKGLQDKTVIRRGTPNPEVGIPVKHVVAVTGDGVNDSPALKAADIGVAMGIVGSDVAKDAADMILLNDDFASIVDGVEEGRLIFDNLKKSIAYTLSSNIPEISPFLIFILAQIPLPLPTVLILCIDLGTDMIPAISLAYEQKEANIMKLKPRDARVDRLVTAKLINFSYLQIGVIQAAAGFYTYVVVLMNYGFPPFFLPGNNYLFYKNVVSQATFFNNVTQETSTDYPWFEYCGLAGEEISPCEYHKLGPCAFEGDDNCWNTQYSLGALQHAQCAFFIAIIVVQWADLVICKTRTLSIFEQGMRNNTLNFGLFFTTILGSALCYIEPLNAVFGTAQLKFVHWCPAMPFCLIIFLYDETRKFFIRRNDKGWVKENTYY